MEKKEEALQTDVMVKRRKWKNRLGAAAMAAIIIAVSAVSVGSYVKTRQTASFDNTDGLGFTQNTNANLSGESGMVMAAGTTSVGVKAVTFDVDFLEDTSLYVEEVYLTNGDSVKAGDKYIKFTEESIASAREELESAALRAQLAYRSGQISDGESRLQAKYTYDMAMLEAQFASQVYDDTIAQLDADFAQSTKTYEKAQQEYNEYLERVQKNTFYEDYDIAGLKKAYEEAKELYAERKDYWEVTDDELKSGSSENIGTTGTMGPMILSGSAGEAAASGESTSEQKSEPKNEFGEVSEADNAGFAGFGDMAKREEQNDRKWIIKTVSLLEQETQEAEESYMTALEEYESEIASAELTLQKLLNQLETAREDFTDAEVSYQKQSLNAKTVYETAVAKGKTAQDDYDTQLTSLKDTLDRLQDAKEEADTNLALFEALVGDGYLYMEESGSVMMLMAEEGQALTGGSVIFAYSDPDQFSVSVSVSQDDIAKLYVGEKASVVVSEHGNYSGVIETINPIAASNSRTSVSYAVTVKLQGDVSGLEANLTANVLFGEDISGPSTSENTMPEDTTPERVVPDSEKMSKEFSEIILNEGEKEHGQPADTKKKTHDAQD